MFYTIPQSHCRIIERFGKFARVQREGVNFSLPFFETFKYVNTWGTEANKGGLDIELSEQQTDTPTRLCHTRDNVAVQANASVYWRILDARKAVYEIDVLPRSVADIALNALRSNIGEMALDSVLSERSRLNEKIALDLEETAGKWGIQFTRVEIQELQTSDETSRAMLQQAEADRHSRAAVARATGEAEAKVKIAEADRQAAVMRAEGEAKAMALMAEAEPAYLEALLTKLSPEDAARMLLAQKTLRGFEAISEKPGDKVFLPNSFQGVLGIDTSPAAPRPPAPPLE